MPDNMKKFIQSRSFQGILIGLGIAIVILFIFEAGVSVGYHKAAFSFRSGDNFYRAFGDRRMTVLKVPVHNMPMEAHGAAGNIVSVDLPTFVVADRDNVEKEVLIATDTILRHFDESIQPSDLKVGDFTVVIGEPNEESQIEAKLIRVLPPPIQGMFR